MPRALAIALSAAVLAILAAIPATASADSAWLCGPHASGGDPCRGDLTTRYYESDGSSRVATTDVPADPPVDCFYVYPTVSNQPTTNATKAADPEVRAIATYQAQRFSARCRVIAPLYRQVTAVGVSQSSQTHDTTPYDTAYADVREAWLDYLRNDNHGRGVILIGHSQGSRMLRALIRREIDRDPAARRLLVSAIIPGANTTDADFANVPVCERAAQTGCVMSWSTYNEQPPDNPRFGRTDTDPVGSALDLPRGGTTKVICTNPAELSGDGGQMQSLSPSAPFPPGVIAALLVRLYGGPPPSADTPWLQPTDHYTGRCEVSNNANVLMIAPVAGARMLTPSPDDTWGTHLVDLNLMEGNLLTITAAQIRTWTAAAGPQQAVAAKLRARRLGRRQGRLIVTLSGPPGGRVRVVLRRGSRTVAHRTVGLKASGRRTTHFRVRAAGSYRVTVTGSSGSARSSVARLKLR